MRPQAMVFAFAAWLGTVLAAPALPVDIAPTPAADASEAFVTAYPVCGIKGFTQEPGDHEMGALESQMLSLVQCRIACQQNGTCQSVSYAANYKLCSFYSEPAECDQLSRDNTSFFAHWDNACAFGRDDDVGGESEDEAQ